MCLINVNKICFIAESDMIVYKHIICHRDSKDKVIGYETSYRFAPVVFKKVLHSKLVMYSDGYGDKRVDEGFHSFIRLEDARKQAEHFNEVLVQCTITKGSKYYMGKYYVNEGKIDCIASSKIRYDKVITEYNIYNAFN